MRGGQDKGDSRLCDRARERMAERPAAPGLVQSTAARPERGLAMLLARKRSRSLPTGSPRCTWAPCMFVPSRAVFSSPPAPPSFFPPAGQEAPRSGGATCAGGPACFLLSFPVTSLSGHGVRAGCGRPARPGGLCARCHTLLQDGGAGLWLRGFSFGALCRHELRMAWPVRSWAPRPGKELAWGLCGPSW